MNQNISSKTIPNVFIIESLKFDDEQNNRFEGKILSQVLHLGNKESAYCYVQNKEELKKAIKLFEKSNYRYLHISCHGSRSCLFTTLDKVPFDELASYFSNGLEGKRLFISACYMVDDEFVKTLFSKTNCLSIIGLDKEINVREAAIIWSTFYYFVFKEDLEKINRDTIKPALRAVRDTFKIKLNYYALGEDLAQGYVEVNY